MNPLIAAKNKENFSCWMIVLFHLTGLIGTAIPAVRDLFRHLAPWHLLVMFGFIVWNHKGAGKNFVRFVMLTGLLGYIAEWLGVHTHLLFGNYHYGATLGVRIWGIPAVMCLNWFMLIYCAGVTANRLPTGNKWLRLSAGALTLVLLDSLIEPVAGRLDYWHFQNNTPPLYNYVCWFIVSFALLGLFIYFKLGSQNKVAPLLLFMQFLFFFGLIILI